MILNVVFVVAQVPIMVDTAQNSSTIGGKQSFSPVPRGCVRQDGVVSGHE